MTTTPTPQALDLDELERQLEYALRTLGEYATEYDSAAQRLSMPSGAEAASVTIGAGVLALLAEVRSHREREAADGWIRCEERMPPTGMTVIVEGGTAQFDGIEWRSVSANLRPIEWTVTHWQHLPMLSKMRTP